MAILKSKLMLIILIIIAVGIILYFTGRKSVRAEITIDTNPSAIWSVLTTTDQIQEWNSVLIPVEGELKEGEKVKYEFRQEGSDPAVMSATVIKMEEHKLINQKGGLTGILTFNHTYKLEDTGDGVKVIIHEEYRGIGVNFWNPTPVQVAYEKLLRELDERVKITQ